MSYLDKDWSQLQDILLGLDNYVSSPDLDAWEEHSNEPSNALTIIKLIEEQSEGVKIPEWEKSVAMIRGIELNPANIGRADFGDGPHLDNQPLPWWFFVPVSVIKEIDESADGFYPGGRGIPSTYGGSGVMWVDWNTWRLLDEDGDPIDGGEVKPSDYLKVLLNDRGILHKQIRAEMGLTPTNRLMAPSVYERVTPKKKLVIVKDISEMRTRPRTMIKQFKLTQRTRPSTHVRMTLEEMEESEGDRVFRYKSGYVELGPKKKKRLILVESPIVNAISIAKFKEAELSAYESAIKMKPFIK